MEPVALPGGPILVPLSLLASAQNEAEFAFQLAHAMAHIALRHSTRQATRGEIANLANVPLKVDQAGNQMMQIGFATLTRRFELEADKVAIGILAATGYDPEVVFLYLGRSTVDGSKMSEIFSVHPTSARRLQAVNAARVELPPAGPDSSLLYKDMLARGVHVLPCAPFHWADPQSGLRYIRLSLARPFSAVEAAARTLAQSYLELSPRPRRCGDGQRRTRPGTMTWPRD